MPWPLLVMLALGLLLLTAGVIGFIRERRRLSSYVLAVTGVGFTGLSGLVLWADYGSGRPIALGLLLLILLGFVLGYPVLMVFLVLNGITMLQRERRTLGNLLSLLLGVGMLLGPLLLIWSASWTRKTETASLTRTFLLLLVIGIAAYLGFCFLCFLVAAFVYRRVPKRFQPRYIVVLGSGLIGHRIPPLLAGRLDKAIASYRQSTPAPILIPSGGQGPGEDVSEGHAMADYLIQHGIPADRIRVEDRATSTRQNLLLSRELMDDPDAPVLVVTTDYHVFRAALLTRELGLDARVKGSRTARYYVPSAFLREFVAVLREHLALNLSLIGAWTLLICAGLVYSLT